jgi:hypothetical protein
MNTAIVIPSINAAPPALVRLREIAPDAEIIVVGDRKSPPEQREFCRGIKARYLGVEEQKALPYRSGGEIPWNCIMRRNLGLLEAIRTGADLIVSVDDDNQPNNDDWLTRFEAVFTGEQRYPLVESETGWFNLGDYASDPFYYRGFPYSLRNRGIAYRDAGQAEKIGIANGLIYGDPDINATERIEKAPRVCRYEVEALDGLAVDPRNTWTPINTQNTAYFGECMALSFVLPLVGRYDDIWASYIAQAVMAASGYAVYFGLPDVTQERNPHNIYKDLQNELMGMEYTERFCDLLATAELLPGSVTDNLYRVANHLRREWAYDFPHAFLMAWIDDLGRLQ